MYTYSTSAPFHDHITVSCKRFVNYISFCCWCVPSFVHFEDRAMIPSRSVPYTLYIVMFWGLLPIFPTYCTKHKRQQRTNRTIIYSEHLQNLHASCHLKHHEKEMGNLHTIIRSNQGQTLTAMLFLSSLVWCHLLQSCLVTTASHYRSDTLSSRLGMTNSRSTNFQGCAGSS